jgi:anaerobic selenocysteine-containing dehydrogenase
MPPRLLLERDDVLFGPRTEALLGHIPYVQWIPAVVAPPDGSEVIDDWYLYWALAERLGLPLIVGKHRILASANERDGPAEAPTTEALLETILAGSRMPFDIVRQYPRGVMCEDVEFVAAPRSDATARFTLSPSDVLDEIGVLLEETNAPLLPDYSHRLIVRRERSAMNSLEVGANADRPSGAPAYLHPDDLIMLGLVENGEIEIASETGSITAQVRADARLRQGVVSISHCRGLMPDEDGTGTQTGSTSLLVRTDKQIEAINAMPVMTAIRVNISRIEPVPC